MAKNREKRRDKFLRARDESKVVQLFKKSQSLKKKFEPERTPPPILALTLKQAEYLGHLRTSEQVIFLKSRALHAICLLLAADSFQLSGRFWAWYQCLQNFYRLPEGVRLTIIGGGLIGPLFKMKGLLAA